MARVIRALIYNGPFNLQISGSVAFTCPANKKWIISKLTTRIVDPGTSVNFAVSIYDEDGFEIFRIFDKGSVPAQTSAEDIKEARGQILRSGQSIRLLGENGPGADAEAALDVEEVDE